MDANTLQYVEQPNTPAPRNHEQLATLNSKLMVRTPRKSIALNHFDHRGVAHMVDVGGKATTHRVAVATGEISMKDETLKVITSGTAKKGDVLGIARIAAIQAAKQTSNLIPLAHPIPITSVSVEMHPEKPTSKISIVVSVETRGQTGVEMEALTAASIGLLTIYDMCKAIDRSMTIGKIRLLKKTGGKSGSYSAPER